jgi:hypothetical protein
LSSIHYKDDMIPLYQNYLISPHVDMIKTSKDEKTIMENLHLLSSLCVTTLLKNHDKEWPFVDQILNGIHIAKQRSEDLDLNTRIKLAQEHLDLIRQVQPLSQMNGLLLLLDAMYDLAKLYLEVSTTNNSKFYRALAVRLLWEAFQLATSSNTSIESTKDSNADMATVVSQKNNILREILKLCVIFDEHVAISMSVHRKIPPTMVDEIFGKKGVLLYRGIVKDNTGMFQIEFEQVGPWKEPFLLFDSNSNKKVYWLLDGFNKKTGVGTRKLQPGVSFSQQGVKFGDKIVVVDG